MALPACSALPAFAAQNVIEVDDTKPGIEINTDNMLGADLAIWNPPSRYYDMTDRKSVV